MADPDPTLAAPAEHPAQRPAEQPAAPPPEQPPAQPAEHAAQTWEVSRRMRTAELLAIPSVLTFGIGYRWDVAQLILDVGLFVMVVFYTARDLRCRPVLRAAPDGLTVHAGWRPRRYPWPEVHRVRVVTDRRSPLLLLDVGDELTLLSRHRLDAPPGAVLEDLERWRAARG